MTRAPADFADEAWAIVEARAESARYSGPTVEALFEAAMAQARADGYEAGLSRAVAEIDDQMEIERMFPSGVVHRRTAEHLRACIAMESEQPEQALAERDAASPLRSAVLSAIGRLRDAAETTELVYGAGSTDVARLREWAAALERALAQEPRE